LSLKREFAGTVIDTPASSGWSATTPSGNPTTVSAVALTAVRV
jgi:hypothetical protein